MCATLLLFGCQGEVEEPLRPTGPGPDPMEPPDEIPCGSAGAAITFFERRCATCHQGSRAYPDLTRGGLAALEGLESQGMPGERLLVPGDPEASWLFRKMAHTQGDDGGAGMPLGLDRPVEQLAEIEAWIVEGAPTACDELAPPSIPYDPNALDPDALFTCADPTAPRSSPTRLRRIDAAEFNAVAIGKASTNPLAPPEGTRYSTYANDITIDAPTVGLLLPQFPRATIEWAVADPQGAGARRMYGVGVVGCMANNADPSDDCIDTYVETLLRRGALFRGPTPEEHARLRAFLTDAMAREATESITRRQTLDLVAQAARLSPGALFRPELGESPDGRRRLTDDELALALGHVISANPPGLPIPNDPSGTISPEDPDADNLAGGRLNRVAAAAADGSIGDPAVRVALLRHYAGGVVAERRPDLSTRGNDNPARGEYWLNSNLLGFFREWLDYGDANVVFKQDPAATSSFEDQDIGPSFSELRSSENGSEGTLVNQLDDLIARVVIETDAGGGDVFETLMTTTEWHLPSNLGAGSTTPCTTDADCGSGQTCTHTMYCTGSTRRKHYWKQAVFGITENVGVLREDRWVSMDPARRMGVLTHPAWLAAHGGNFEDDASLVERGAWIRTHLFCQSFGDLSDVQGLVAMLPPQPTDGSPLLSARQRVVQATEDPATENAQSCYGCHQYMNSLGYAFELYNHAGFEREWDHSGAPDGTTVIDNLPDPDLNRAYASPMELVQAIATSPYARRGFVRHAFRYFMGRDEVMADGCTLAEMEDALNRTGSFLSMLEALISSETFEYRHEGGQ